MVLQRWQRQKVVPVTTGSPTTSETKLFFSQTTAAACLGDREDEACLYRTGEGSSGHSGVSTRPFPDNLECLKISVPYRLPERTLQELTQSSKISNLFIFHHNFSAIHP